MNGKTVFVTPTSKFPEFRYELLKYEVPIISVLASDFLDHIIRIPHTEMYFNFLCCRKQIIG